MSLQKYLNQHYSTSSVKAYASKIDYYLLSIPNPETASYSELIDYLAAERKRQSSSSLQLLLQGIKKYYRYLIEKEIRADNPAQSIYLKTVKSKTPLILSKLLINKELELVWNYFLTKEYRYKNRKNRNISLVGLLLKQGLRRREIEDLKTEHIDLEKGQIYIPSSPKTKARTLALETSQILPFYRYLKEDRPKLLLGKEATKSLFITKNKRTEKATLLYYLVKTSKHLLKDKTVNISTIRMSVIAAQFKRGHSLQQVQYFAGHLYPSTTERYRISNLQALQEGVLKHHPLQ
jgi:integrase/recombinase XerD